MGGLEGLINILDSEGGFGALEIQVILYCNIQHLRHYSTLKANAFKKFQLLPEQAASFLNYAARASIPLSKSPKGAAGFPLPGYESYPENNGSIKM